MFLSIQGQQYLAENVICPVCRSDLQPVGFNDVGAPKIQVVKCPVCGYGIWLPSVPPEKQSLFDPIFNSYRWTGFNVVKNNMTPASPTPQDVAQNSPHINDAPPSSSQIPAFDFQLPESIKNVTNGITNGLVTGALIVAGILVLILMIKRK